jgi:hypothetical protein
MAKRRPARTLRSRSPSSTTSTARTFYIGWYIRDAQRHPQVPGLTHAQHEALALIETIANDPAGRRAAAQQRRILHSREAYDDDDDLVERRHLLRLWLRAHDFTSVEDQLRAGIPRTAHGR